MTICPHHTPAQVAQFAPMPCVHCQGWVIADGEVVDGQTAVRRYPHLAQVMTYDPTPPSSPSVLAGIFEMISIAGKLAWTLLVLLITGAVLAGLIVFLVHVA